MNLIYTNDIPSFTLNTSLKEAKEVCEHTTLSHFPVVEEDKYLGSVARYDIQDSDSDIKIADLRLQFESFSILEDANILESLEILSKYDTNMMPVLSQEEKKYLGYVELQDVLEAMGDMPFLSEHGNIIVVAKGISDQSFSEISQIIESNNVKVLAMYISSMENDMVQTTVKIGDGDFNAVIQTFRRYGYTIISDHYDDVFLNALKERSRYFDKYLNM